MEISIIGTGYVGLVSGICFAKIGHNVICVDNDKSKILRLQSGEVTIYEPGLEKELKHSLSSKTISFTEDIQFAIQNSDIIFIAVGTPRSDKTGKTDLSFVFDVTKQISSNLDSSYKIIVTKSTVPVGTGSKIKKIISQNNEEANVSICSNPEFLREGVALNDFLNPDRIVIGSSDKKSQKIMNELYCNLKLEESMVINTDVKTAELIKYVANCFLATKISFINEVSDLCEKIGGNIEDLINAVGLDSRIGSKFLNPGPGFGGSCFPKDILSLLSTGKENNIDLRIINAVIEYNDKRQENIARKIINIIGDYKNKIISVLGLAFKANTDDVRSSPAIFIIKYLLQHKIKIKSYDKKAIRNAKKELENYNNIEYFDDIYNCTENADAVIIATEWEEFANIDLKLLKNKLKSSLIIDLRNMIDKNQAESYGFRYFSIGNRME